MFLEDAHGADERLVVPVAAYRCRAEIARSRQPLAQHGHAGMRRAWCESGGAKGRPATLGFHALQRGQGTHHRDVLGMPRLNRGQPLAHVLAAGGQRGGQIGHCDAGTSSGCRPRGDRCRPDATSRPSRISAAVSRRSNTASGCGRSVGACGLPRHARQSARQVGTPEGRARAPGPRRAQPDARSVCLDGESPTPGQGCARLGVESSDRGPDGGIADLPIQRVGSQQRLELGRRGCSAPAPERADECKYYQPCECRNEFSACFSQPEPRCRSLSASGGPETSVNRVNR